MKNLVSLPFVASFVVLLSGCPVWGTDNGDGRGTCVGDACFCDTTRDCVSGNYCDPVSDRCVPGECANNTDCTGEQVCNTAHVCVDAPRACRTDGDCDAGAYCAAGACTPSSRCTDDRSCTGGFVCDFRTTCVPQNPPACRTTADCSGSNVCVEGQCRDRGTVCQFNFQCGAGRSCVNNSCVEICSNDAGCGSGEKCVDHLCVDDTNQCDTSSDCSGGKHCVQGRCLADCSGGSTTCSDAQDSCDTDGFCHPSWQTRPFCSDDTQCERGHVCRMGVCRTPCATGTSEECMRYDSQLPVCASDHLCYRTNETMPECATATDCGGTRSCIDALCR